MVEKGLIITWQRQGEQGIYGGVQSQTALLAKTLEIKELSWMDAAKVLGLQVNPDYFRYCIIDRALIIKQYLETYQDLFSIDYVISDDCCCAFSKNKNLISLVNASYLDIAEKIYPKNSPHYFELGEFYTELQKMQFAKSKKIIAVSRYIQDYVKRLGFESEVIHNAVDTRVFYLLENKNKLRKKYGIPQDKKIGIWVGGFHPVKRYHFVARLVRDFPNIFWILVFKHPINYRPKSKNVKIFSCILQEQLRELYNCAHFLVNPSIFESFGLAPIESMACDTPVIVSKTGYFYDKEGPTDFGFVIKDNDYNEYKKAVEEMTLDLGYKWEPAAHIDYHQLDSGSWKAKWGPLIQDVLEKV